jgi:hypothetical protein
MASTTSGLMKVFSPALVAKAMRSFDRATLAVAGICWGGALVMLAFAVYTVSLTVSSKRAAEQALATEPVLPVVSRGSIPPHDLQTMTDRLQHRFSDLKFGQSGTEGIEVSASDGGKFRDWLSSIDYVDTIAPQYHWTLREFCVGKCTGTLMRAILVGERIAFAAPPQ